MANRVQTWLETAKKIAGWLMVFGVVDLVADADNKCVVIMKDGKIYKNTVT